MSKGTYRLLTLQILDTVLLFAVSVIYIAYSPAYSWVTRTSDCQIKISRHVPSDLISGLLVLSVSSSKEVLEEYVEEGHDRLLPSSVHHILYITWLFNALYMLYPRYIETR
jgi:hypothetical protein